MDDLCQTAVPIRSGSLDAICPQDARHGLTSRAVGCARPRSRRDRAGGDPMRDDLLTRLGERIRALRMVQDINQAALGARVGLAQPSISSIEAGRQNVSVTTLARLAAELATSVGVLLGELPLPELPRVWVTADNTAACQRCGPLGVAATFDGAYEQRQAHIRAHLIGAVGREVAA